MNIKLPGVYHIYNRGNNRQRIFFEQNNYDYFIKKCHHYLTPVCHVLSWCLMPNHFHLLVEVRENGLREVKSGSATMPAISNAIRLILSSYAKAINKQEDRTGNLFQQKTKSKGIQKDTAYLRTAFLYIHQNPVTAKLVKRMEQWKYSSFNEFFNPTVNGLSDTQKALELMMLKHDEFEAFHKHLPGDEEINNIL